MLRILLVFEQVTLSTFGDFLRFLLGDIGKWGYISALARIFKALQRVK